MIQEVVDTLLADKNLKSATKYLAANSIIRATRHGRKVTRSETLLLTLGKPNFAEREFIKDCIRAGEPFPVKKIQLKPWPQKRPRKLSALTGYGPYSTTPTVVLQPGSGAYATAHLAQGGVSHVTVNNP